MSLEKIEYFTWGYMEVERNTMKKIILSLSIALFLFTGCETKKIFIEKKNLNPTMVPPCPKESIFVIRQRVLFWDDKTIFVGNSNECLKFIELNNIKLEYSDIGVRDDE